MKADIHPNYRKIKVVCSCGNSFDAWSTIEKDTLNVEICSACHPFYTGKQKIVDTAGRVEKFQKRYAAKPAAPAPKVEEAAPAKKATKAAEKKSATKSAEKTAEKKPAAKKSASKTASKATKA